MRSRDKGEALDLLRCAVDDLERAADRIRLATTGAPYELVNQARPIIEGAMALVNELEAE